MSATAAKGTRRDLRRAVGAETVDLIQAHESGLRMHAEALGTHAKMLDEQSRLIALGVKAREALRAEAQADVQRVREFLHQNTLRGRLRWLLTGR